MLKPRLKHKRAVAWMYAHIFIWKTKINQCHVNTSQKFRATRFNSCICIWLETYFHSFCSSLCNKRAVSFHTILAECENVSRWLHISKAYDFVSSEKVPRAPISAELKLETILKLLVLPFYWRTALKYHLSQTVLHIYIFQLRCIAWYEYFLITSFVL